MNQNSGTKLVFGTLYCFLITLNNPLRSFPGQGTVRLSEDQKALERINQENADLRMERDILKKAIGIFSKKNR